MNKNMTIEELQKIIIENFTTEKGNIDISGLEFKTSINMSNLKIKGDLDQGGQQIGGNLNQESQKIGGHLDQEHQKVAKTVYQSGQQVGGRLLQIQQDIGGNLNQDMTIEELNVKNLKNEKTIELVEFMKKNFMSEEGDIYVDGMDFSQFEGNVYINNSIFLNDVSLSHTMVIKGDFYCECNNVGGSIYQTMQKSGNRISQNGHSAYNGILEGGHIVKTPQVRVEPQLRGTFAAKTPE